MNLSIKAILFIALFFYSSLAYTCSCIAIETFCETIAFGNGGEIHPNYQIMRIKVGKKTNQGREGKIQEMLQGTETRSKIEIISGNGASCGISTDIFNKGDDLLVAFWGSSESGYTISSCGINFLRIENGTLKGKISPGVDRLPYKNLDKLKECGNLSALDFNFPISLFPNPVNTEANLYLEVERPTKADIIIFSTSGRMVKQLSLEYDQGDVSNTIPVDDLPPAMYFIELNVGAQRKVLKLMVL